MEHDLVKRNQEKQKTNEFLTSGRLLSTEIVIERNLYINKDNQVLLNKLVEISHGKWVSLLILT